jgi:hypothetical protein
MNECIDREFSGKLLSSNYSLNTVQQPLSWEAPSLKANGREGNFSTASDDNDNAPG